MSHPTKARIGDSSIPKGMPKGSHRRTLCFGSLHCWPSLRALRSALRCLGPTTRLPAAAMAAAAVTAAAAMACMAAAMACTVAGPAVAGPCTCLTKEYTSEGAVLFKDRCTNEMAMNPPLQQSGAIEPQAGSAYTAQLVQPTPSNALPQQPIPLPK